MDIVALGAGEALDEAVKSIGTETRLIICGPPEEEAEINERLVISGRTSEEILAASMDIDVVAWFEEQRQEMEEEWEVDLAENEGEWPGESMAKQGFTGTSDVLTGKPLKELIGVKLPSSDSWKIPAYLRFGGWNDCPDPEVHCAIWRYWENKYGAAIIGVSSDVVEAHVARPPATESEAMALAWEQYLYCYDIVEQGVETVSNLGAGLMNHKFWYFWWD